MGLGMDVTQEVIRVLDEVLSLQGRTVGFTPHTPLLNAVPELDSMAVVSLITSLEERFDILIDDGDIDADVFRTVGSLSSFVQERVAA